ncbi:MAG: hypothetical protein HYX51_07295 [Chloroflexi bacterium]|nr:hypothetical protein [Chloroflexota bacterium]
MVTATGAATERMQACHLYAPDGSLLAAGVCHFDTAADPNVLVATVEDRPGLLIQRYLLKDTGDIWLHLKDGRLIAARLIRTLFDPKRGRLCILRAVEHPEHPPITPLANRAPTV